MSNALIHLKGKAEVILLYGIGYTDLVGQIYNKHRRIPAFIFNETMIQIGNNHFWLWICIEPIDKSVLGIYISE